MAILTYFFKIKNIIFKFLTVTLFIAINILCIYVSLTIAALMGLEKSTEWTISYVTSFISSFFMIGPITNYFKI
jgi:hypothetical protein